MKKCAKKDGTRLNPRTVYVIISVLIYDILPGVYLCVVYAPVVTTKLVVSAYIRVLGPSGGISLENTSPFTSSWSQYLHSTVFCIK